MIEYLKLCIHEMPLQVIFELNGDRSGLECTVLMPIQRRLNYSFILDKQRVEDELNNNEEPIIASTLTRS